MNNQDSSGAAGPPSSVRLQIYSNDPVTGKPSANIGQLIMNLSGMTNPITPLRGHGLVMWKPVAPFSLALELIVPFALAQPQRFFRVKQSLSS